uniref:NADH-ubiquinone oxidoreductase chain 4L n=1 Tax=Apochrysa matsumurae TaxID=417555 RepID=E6N2N4_APOMA|nr:NADH dehydrogenase subunit 4L [Apochrysa matsumurae]BAJ61143.1 NADH dehydrogenase subunit 4L [Apochrysa matsumurae]
MFMNMNMLLSMIMFLSGVIVYVLKRKHLLSTLLSLEFIVLSLFYLLFMMYMNYNYEYYFSMIFLVFSVCEGALGLSLLVTMIRTHGNDYFQTFNVLMC